MGMYRGVGDRDKGEGLQGGWRVNSALVEIASESLAMSGHEIF